MGNSGYIPVLGVDVVTGDARYWKLDCSNGPSVGNWNHQGNFLIGAAGVTNPDPTLLYPNLYVGQNANSCGITGAAFANAGTSYPRMSLLKGRGTHAIPAAVLANDYLGSVDFWGQRDATVGHIAESSSIECVATKNWSAGDTASEINFYTTLQGTTGRSKRLTIADTGDLFQQIGIYYQKDGATFYGGLDFTSNPVLTVVNKTLTVNLADVNRTLTFSGSPTLGDWFDQNVKTTSTPTFARGAYGTTVHATDILTVLSADTVASGNVVNISHSGSITGSHTGINYVGTSVCTVEQIGQSITLSGGSGTNTCLKLSASGATNNYCIYGSAGNIYVANYIKFNDTDQNTQIGYQAGLNLPAGATWNTFIGYQAGKGGVITIAAVYNTAVGQNSLNALTSGTKNTAVGAASLGSIKDGSQNFGLGYNSLAASVSDSNNIAIGTSCLFSVKGSSGNNIGIGTSVLQNANSSANNVAIGHTAGRYAGGGSGTQCTAINNSILIGYYAEGLNASGDTNEIVIGYSGIGLGSNTTVIGNSSTTGALIWGNLGVGTAALPAALNKLDVLQTSTTTLSTGLNVLHSGTGIAGTAQGAVISVTGTNTTNTALTLSASGGTNNYGLIVSAGKVGIGTATPAEALSVIGKLTVGQATGSAATLSVKQIGSEIILHAKGSGGADYLYLNSTGSLGIGLDPSTLNKLDVRQASTAASSVGLNILHSGLVAGGLSTVYGQRISVTGANAVNIGLDFSAGVTGATTNYWIYANSTNYWNASGELYVSGTCGVGYLRVSGDSGVGVRSGYNITLDMFGRVANSATNIGVRFGNVNALTAGTDRYIAAFCNDLLTTVKSRINTLGQYETLDTSAAFYVRTAFTSSVALNANRALTFDLLNADRTLKFGNAHIADADAGTIVAQFNTLLSELETAGIILAA